MDYEKALEKARSAYGTGAYDDATLEFLFPQLKESEDERIKKIITDSVFYQYGAGVEYKDVLDYLDKLEKQKEQKPWKVGANAYFTPEQKPAEWSDEDTEMYINVASSLRGYACGLENEDHKRHIQKGLDWLENRFKSPRPSWKPSEEHLSALLAVLNDPNNIGSQTCQLALTDLYEHLKKLGVKEDPEYYQHFDPDC